VNLRSLTYFASDPKANTHADLRNKYSLSEKNLETPGKSTDHHSGLAGKKVKICKGGLIRSQLRVEEKLSVLASGIGDIQHSPKGFNTTYCL